MAYNPSANGLAEAFNKTIIKILSKLTSNGKRDWDEKLGESLWAYRTTVRTPIGATPYSLVYGCEVVLPLEIQIPSLCIALATGMTTEESHQQRLAELEALDEKRLEAQQHIEFYRARISKAFDKKVKHRSFKEGELVLAVRRPMILNSKKKTKVEEVVGNAIEIAAQLDGPSASSAQVERSEKKRRRLRKAREGRGAEVSTPVLAQEAEEGEDLTTRLPKATHIKQGDIIVVVDEESPSCTKRGGAVVHEPVEAQARIEQGKELAVKEPTAVRHLLFMSIALGSPYPTVLMSSSHTCGGS
ncbi:uncharacterized protein LOC109846304 [Asparagus officinalis]|uniref:uncharacterized protein LOC109846304 n=1 Tax=Asparagus officinalis TaxID=4686 RepID=UPI00098E782E|nr:uncharacterized protein LOC109846304 [Asparagus officinalis]